MYMSVTSIQLLSRVQLFWTPWAVACSTSLSITYCGSFCLLPSWFYCISYFLFDEADAQSYLCWSCTDSCSLTLILRSTQLWLFPSTFFQKVCCTSFLLNWSFWLIYFTGISGNPWISAFQWKTSSHPSPLLSIRGVPRTGCPFYLSRALIASNIVSSLWKVNHMACC